MPGKLITLVIFLTISLTGIYAQSDSVFICKVDDNNNILLEDHLTREKNQDTSKDPFMYYDRYSQSIIDMLINLGLYNENKSIYNFDKDNIAFEQYSNIRIGDVFYLATSAKVYTVKAIGYKIFLEDVSGAGNIFYVVLENPEPSGTGKGTVCIASKNPNIRTLDTTGVTDPKIIDKFQNIINNLIPEKSINAEDFTPYQTLKIFSGQFVDQIRMPQRPVKQYLVSFLKKTGLETYSCLVNIFDEDGVLLKELVPVQIDSFDFRDAIGIIDVNGDGKQEILTEWGYYEGWGLELFRLEGEKYISIADGFFFGL